jgi:hypothetical protein
MERWLQERAPAWQSRRITTAIISSQPILDTRMGHLLDRFCAELLAPADRERWRSTCVSCSDLAEATVELLEECGPGSPGGLVRLFLTGPDDVADHVAHDDPRTLYPLAWTLITPTWREDALSAGI